VKTRRGITTPGILSPVVMRRAKKRKNSSSARHYDQIRFRFYTAWVIFDVSSERRPLPQFPPKADIRLRCNICRNGP
jgi:hypothetical protein